MDPIATGGNMDGLLALFAVWFPIVTSAVGTFALIATITPNKADDKISQVLLDLVNFLGANLGKAKNDPSK